MEKHNISDINIAVDDIDKAQTEENQNTKLLTDSPSAEQEDEKKLKKRDGSTLFTIDRNAISMKVSYFLEGWQKGSHFPLLVVFFIEMGLSKSQAGLIAGLRLLGRLASGIIWGLLADKTKKHRFVFSIQIFGAIIFMCSPTHCGLLL